MNLQTLLLVLTGMAAGITAGFFGIGGGVIIVPALIYILGFSQHRAVGTSLAILLPPVGLAAVLEYHRHGNVDVQAAVVVAAALFVGGWLGALVANNLNEQSLKIGWGVFMILIGVHTIFTAVKSAAPRAQSRVQPVVEPVDLEIQK